MDSLLIQLNKEIKARGVVPYEDIVWLAKQWGYYRPETALRRLRPSESPCVRAIKKKGLNGVSYISAYKWICVEPEPLSPEAHQEYLLKISTQ